MSMNNVSIMGRITQDLEIRAAGTGKNAPSVLSFNVAVDRDYVPDGEERECDFISCVAWRQTAEFINKYFGKGRMIGIIGRLQTRKYDDKRGVTHYVTEIVVEKAYFTGEKSEDDKPKKSGKSKRR